MSTMIFSRIFRVLIPSWRFFDDIAHVPVLLVRIGDEAWRPVLQKAPSRSWKHLLLNTEQNRLFACHSLLDQMVSDLETGSDSRVSQDLIRNLVAAEFPSDTQFQFKLTVGEGDVFVSDRFGFSK